MSNPDTRERWMVRSPSYARGWMVEWFSREGDYDLDEPILVVRESLLIDAERRVRELEDRVRELESYLEGAAPKITDEETRERTLTGATYIACTRAAPRPTKVRPER